MIANLRRMLAPRSVAVVGASERRRMSTVAVGHLLSAPVELHLVNPKGGVAFGRDTVTSLSAIGRPVDAVLSLVGAAATVEVVDEAGATGCGGVIVIASGFGEMGDEGKAMQHTLVTTAARNGTAILGPNCTGFANVAQNTWLFTGTSVPVRAGGLSILSQSGYLTRAAMVAARERNLGVHLAVSCGNEASVGVPDLIELLADDRQTQVICVVLEKVRDAERFFAAVARARAAGKAVIAAKLGTSERGRDIVRSHTGALATEAWVYDIGLRQAGIVVARDLEDLFDCAQFLVQLPPERWRPLRNVAVISSSGGVAALASDTIAGGATQLPTLEQLLPAVREQIPTAPYSNPLDLTGFAVEPPDVVERLLEVFTESGEVDAVTVVWWLGEDDEDRAQMLLVPLRNVAARTDVQMVMATVESSRLGEWTTRDSDGRVLFSRGLRGTERAMAAMTEHMTHRGAQPGGTERSRRAPIARPATVESEAGPIVGFADAMALLADHGVGVGPWAEATDDAAIAALGNDLVVKLADVAHRTELGAVKVGVDRTDISDVSASLAKTAAAHGLSERVVVQSRVTGIGEAFVGFRTHTDLGPVVVVGLGGVQVELARRVVGRLLPITEADVHEMLEELGGDAVLRGVRGGPLWNREALVQAVLGIAELGARASDWLVSIDVNPLICDERTCTAVDALLLTTPT